MRIIRRKKLKHRKPETQDSKINKIRSQVDIFESEGIIYAHLLHVVGVWDIKQCIILDGTQSIYRGMKVFEMDKFRIKLEDLDEADLNFLVKELEYANR